MNLFLRRLRSRTRKLFGLRRSSLTHRNLRERFTYVYRNRAWGAEGSASGPGSDRDSGSVRQAVQALSTVIRDHDIQSLADVPCGDFNWMPEVLRQHPHLRYVGYDIVEPLVASNRKAHPKVAFRLLDITTEVPAKADLVFSKDLINHLLERDVWRALANMIRTGATYLMVTSNSDPVSNTELPCNVGGYSRVLNLRIPPYSFPEPIYDDGYLAMWKVEDLAFVPERAG